ncbi:hypothetical protein ACRQ5Q_14625 [Bradyrhizobium sp. PMVTL-01]|uniref:hypothetical protein n=1 Tax=Bradyrhizobium sp. PMVTL-01 TaxID=3434999 RepID=UPI003F72D447
MSAPERDLNTMLNAAELMMHGLKDAMAIRIARQWDEKCKDVSELRLRLIAAEQSLNTYDEHKDSFYWRKYDKPI